MACTFCATGTMGLKGDLTAGEILEQVLHASRVAPIRNVVFMGGSRRLKAHFRRTSILGIIVCIVCLKLFVRFVHPLSRQG